MIVQANQYLSGTNPSQLADEFMQVQLFGGRGKCSIATLLTYKVVPDDKVVRTKKEKLTLVKIGQKKSWKDQEKTQKVKPSIFPIK